MSQNDMPEGGGIVGFLFGVIFAVVILGASLAWLDTRWPLGVTIAIAIGLWAYPIRGSILDVAPGTPEYTEREVGHAFLALVYGFTRRER